MYCKDASFCDDNKGLEMGLIGFEMESDNIDV